MIGTGRAVVGLDRFIESFVFLLALFLSSGTTAANSRCGAGFKSLFEALTRASPDVAISQDDPGLKEKTLVLETDYGSLCGPTCLTNLTSGLRAFFGAKSPYLSSADEVAAVCAEASDLFRGRDVARSGIIVGQFKDLLLSHLKAQGRKIPRSKLNITDTVDEGGDILVDRYFNKKGNRVSILAIGPWVKNLEERIPGGHVILLMYDPKKQSYFVRDPLDSRSLHKVELKQIEGRPPRWRRKTVEIISKDPAYKAVGRVLVEDSTEVEILGQ